MNAQPVPTTRKVVRIKAGSSTPVTDSQGNVWLADQGFNGGEVIERSHLVVTNTAEPEIYRSEHYSMNSFSWPLPNGNYLVKLYFCETFEGITDAGQRVFSFNVQGRDFMDFDVWAKAGGPLIAHVETVPVEIKDGKLLITFTSKFENPQINAIELIPQS
ncbi:MAG: malectin [Limisphaerales bacterium]